MAGQGGDRAFARCRFLGRRAGAPGLPGTLSERLHMPLRASTMEVAAEERRLTAISLSGPAARAAPRRVCRKRLQSALAAPAKPLTTRQGGEVWTAGQGLQILDLGSFHYVWQAQCYARWAAHFEFIARTCKGPCAPFPVGARAQATLSGSSDRSGTRASRTANLFPTRTQRCSR